MPGKKTLAEASSSLRSGNEKIFQYLFMSDGNDFSKVQRQNFLKRFIKNYGGAKTAGRRLSIERFNLLMFFEFNGKARGRVNFTGGFAGETARRRFA